MIADDIRVIHQGGFKPDLATASENEAAAEVCETCRGGGLECRLLGNGVPYFRTCPTCGNPKGHPSP